MASFGSFIICILMRKAFFLCVKLFLVCAKVSLCNAIVVFAGLGFETHSNENIKEHPYVWSILGCYIIFHAQTFVQPISCANTQRECLRIVKNHSKKIACKHLRCGRYAYVFIVVRTHFCRRFSTKFLWRLQTIKESKQEMSMEQLESLAEQQYQYVLDIDGIHVICRKPMIPRLMINHRVIHHNIWFSLWFWNCN